jgi:triosephosphate isomerase
VFKDFVLKVPFFEIGPKAYVYGETSLKIAKEADKLAEKYNVHVIYTPQYVDIPIIAHETKHISVFSQHMDPIRIGRGIGSVLPEALKSAGAVGTLLNHAEKKMTLSDISKAIKRADEVGLATAVCADNLVEALAIAQFEPNIIILEPENLIGTQQGKVSSRDYIEYINNKIKTINPDIHVLHSGGIHSGKDVYDLIFLGAEGTGSTSAIMEAEDPLKKMEEMISSVRKAWDDRAKMRK